MVDNAHVAFAATRLDEGASVSPEQGIVFRIGICFCALFVSFQSLDCNSLDSILVLESSMCSPFLLIFCYKTLEWAVPSSIHSSRASGSSGSKTQKGLQKTQTLPRTFQQFGSHTNLKTGSFQNASNMIH